MGCDEDDDGQAGKPGFLDRYRGSGGVQGALNEELGLATAGLFDVEASDDRTPRVLEAVYRIAARLDPDAALVSADLLEAHSHSFSDADRRAVLLMLKAIAPQLSARSDAAEALTSIGPPANDATIRDAGVQILLGRAEAQARARLITHPMIAASGNPLSRLMDDDTVAALRCAASPSTTHATSVPAEVIESPYLTIDTRRFSEIIEPTIAAIQLSGDWNEDTGQPRPDDDGKGGRSTRQGCLETEIRRPSDHEFQ